MLYIILIALLSHCFENVIVEDISDNANYEEEDPFIVYEGVGK